MRHIVNAQQFSVEFMEELFNRARYYKGRPKMLVANPLALPNLVGRLVLKLFYEPSTRTRLSFEAAAHWLGMGVVSTENAAEFSSAAKGETIEDTIRVVAGYGFSVVVMRHKEEGAAQQAAKLDVVPIINAGDGSGQHPTQALLDLFTIYERCGRLDNLQVLIGGDLARGRTVRSLAYLLGKYPGNQLTFLAPEPLQIGPDILDYLARHKIGCERITAVGQAPWTKADVVYWTRLQIERPLPNGKTLSPEQVEELKPAYTLTPAHLARMKTGAVLMHPLPRVGEIATTVDADPRAAYFAQAHNGLYVRMALLEHVCGLW